VWKSRQLAEFGSDRCCLGTESRLRAARELDDNRATGPMCRLHTREGRAPALLLGHSTRRGPFGKAAELLRALAAKPLLAWQDCTSTLAHAAHVYRMMVLSFGCTSDRWLSLACIYGSSNKQRRVLCMFARLKAKDGKQHAYWLQTLARVAAYARAGTGRRGVRLGLTDDGKRRMRYPVLCSIKFVTCVSALAPGSVPPCQRR
jgi:hypothetical protein